MPAPPLVAVVGATGTGKSEVGIALAREFDGEVVSVDAYQIYRGLDIGTAKIKDPGRTAVVHHLLDIVEPDQPFSLALFLEAAQEALADIWAREKLPILAGGSGQHIWALLEGWQVPRVPPNLELRQKLDALTATSGPGALVSELAALDPDAARQLDPRNPRRLIRAIEIVSQTDESLARSQRREALDARVLILGLSLPRAALFERLDLRVDQMFAEGFVSEIELLRRRGFGDSRPIRGGVGYRQISAYLDGEFGLGKLFGAPRTRITGWRGDNQVGFAKKIPGFGG